MAATLGDGPFPRTGGWEKASNDVRAVISVAANYELTTLSWGDIWTPAGEDPIKARQFASPVNHVKKEMKPLLVLHSDNDQSVPIDNALGMVEALKKAGAPHVFHRYPDNGPHGHHRGSDRPIAGVHQGTEQDCRKSELVAATRRVALRR